VTAGYCGTTRSSRGYPEVDGVLTTQYRRSTAERWQELVGE
jgi:hypothetical protein